MNGIHWRGGQTPADVFNPALDDYQKALDASLRAVAEFWATKVQNEARARAAWTDRTSNARNGLIGFVQEVGAQDTINIFMTTQVEYGVYLELSNAGRYAIVWPMILANLPVLQQMLSTLLKD